MVYLLIPADYHVRQGRKRDTARGDEADTGNAYARSADGGSGFGVGVDILGRGCCVGRSIRLIVYSTIVANSQRSATGAQVGGGRRQIENLCSP